MLAVHVLREAGPGTKVTLIGQGPFGRGVAYGTHNPDHLLNVRVANMSAFADDPSHFLRWLWMQDVPAYADIPPSGHAFVSRKTYGDYVVAVFEELCAGAGPAVTTVDAAAVQLHPGLRPSVTLADGRRLYFDRIALCVGNFPAGPPPGLSAAAQDSAHYVNDPWQWTMAGLAPEDDILILGSGLTMADTVQSLLGKGHQGQIRVISRRGLVPLRHEPARTYELKPPTGSLVEMLAAVRENVRVAVLGGYDWRHVFDALRPYTAALWQGLSVEDQARFLRHLRPYWDVHRHRLAPAVADAIADLRARGCLRIDAGRAVAIDRDGDGFIVDLALRDGSTSRIKPRWIINCTGAARDFRAIGDPLMQGALDRGVIRPDPLGLGIDVTAGNVVIGADGEVSENIVAIGPPTRGRFWEVIAVPDIRGACARVAKTLAAPLPAR